MKPLTGVCTLIVIASAVLFTIQCGVKHRNRQEAQPWTLTQAEIKYINENLNKRSVGDCAIEPTYYGWKCTARDGKVYRIARM
jgi:5-bromo-4-chloroindolyl phosphate hydrolysis protein